MLQADVSDNSSCSPSSVFMLKIFGIQEMYSSYEVDPVLEADIPNLSWHVGYLGIPWGEKKKTKRHCAKQVDSCQQIPKCLRGRGAHSRERCP